MRLVLSLTATALFIAGCSTFDHVDQIEKKTDADMQAGQLRNQAARNMPTKQARPTVVYIDGPWVSLKPMTIAEKKDEPVLRCKVKMATLEAVSILELGQIITKYCVVPVRITADALAAIESPSTPDEPTSAAVPGAPAPVSMVPAGQAKASSSDNKLIDINYTGELAGLLDMVAARFGISWKIEDGRIKIYNVDTATFYLHSIATSTAMKSTVESGTTLGNGSSSGSGGGSGGTGGGGSSGTTQNTTVSLKTSIWDDVKASIDSMKSARGRVAVSPATGSVTVTDTREVLERVGTYIKRENDNLTKQVFFSIRVLSVRSTTKDDMSLNWEAVWTSVSQRYGFNLTSPSTSAEGAANGMLSILKGTSSPWAGTNAIIGALNEQGRVTTLREPTASTLNLQPVSLQVASQDGFVAGQTTQTTAQVGATTTTQTGTITTGFNMSLLPYVMEDNRMLLMFSVNLSNLRNLRKFGEKGSMAELPEIDQPINSTQQVRLKPGETLVMSGFDTDDGNSTRQGAGHASNVLFGGAVKGTSTRSTLVVLITPVIME